MYFLISLGILIACLIGGVQPYIVLPFVIFFGILNHKQIARFFKVIGNMNGGISGSKYFKMWAVFTALMLAGSIAAYMHWQKSPNTLILFWVGGTFWIYSKSISNRTTQQPQARDRVLRGSALIQGGELQRLLWGNTPTDDFQICIGEVRIPANNEGQHFLITGMTGSGKTQALNKILRVIRCRGQRAVVSDSGGGFVSRFYRSGDIIFNPFDKRCVPWSPFMDIREEYDTRRIAEAAIPVDLSSSDKSWNEYARALLGDVLLALYKRGDHSVKTLLHYVSVANSAELGALLENLPASVLCQRGNDKMLSNTRSIIATFLSAWRYLPDRGTFSMRDWIQNESRENWCFVSYRDDQMGMLKTLVSTLLELGIVEGLSLEENPDRGLWFVMDEVDSLGKVSSLGAGLTRGRKYGNKFICGLQTISQFRTTYGHDEAQTLLGNFATKLILRPGDNQTAEYFSNEIGQQEIERLQVTTSEGYSNTPGGFKSEGSSSSSSNTSTNQVRETRATVLPSQIMALPDLHGFLRVPACPIASVHIQHESLPKVADSFQRNGVAQIAPVSDNRDEEFDRL